MDLTPNLNVTQYGTIFAAYGCDLNYNSARAALEVVGIPEGRGSIIEAVLRDIQHFDDTTNYVDGAAAIALADTIDHKKNPLSKTVRNSVLNSLHVMDEDRFIYQVLSLQKNNRSWHVSPIANDCQHFGEICTHRGINPDPERKGRRSHRQPNEYHQRKGDIVAREQLVTPALQEMFDGIPEDNLVSGIKQGGYPVDIKKLKDLPLERRLAIIAELESVA